jgi:hypothetical protein
VFAMDVGIALCINLIKGIGIGVPFIKEPPDSLNAILQ